MPDTKQREPQIATSLVNGVRRTLIEDGRWERIEEDVLARAPELADWLAAAERAEWVSLERYLLFMDTLLGVLGVEALATLGATRLKEDVDVGALARMLRAWLREFRSDAGALLRVAPHAWQAATRNAGRMVVVDSTPGHMSFRVESPPPAVIERRGWHVFLEGFGGELLRQSGRQGSFSIGPEAGSLSLAATWSESGSTRG